MPAPSSSTTALSILFALASYASAQSPVPPSGLSLPLNLEQAAASWDFDPARVKLIESDESAKAPALAPQVVPKKSSQVDFTSKETFRPPIVLEAEVRLPQRTADLQKGFYRGAATLALVDPGAIAAASPAPNAKAAPNNKAAPDASAPVPATHSVTINRARFRDDHSYATSSKSGALTASFNLKPRFTMNDVSPLMDESLRVTLERFVPQTPVAHDRIHRLRLEVRDGAARMYVDGRLTGEYPAATTIPGKAVLTLLEDARVLSFRVRPLENTVTAGAFVPVPLDDFCNATGPARAKDLPAERGRIAEIQGVPFVSSQGFRDEDHLDVGQSVHHMRMGDMRNGDAREAVVAPEEIELTRFTMRVPNRTWRRAWVVAGSDGDSNSAPVLTVRFFKPRTQWLIDAATDVPTYTATSAPAQAKRLATTGKGALWLIPIDLDAAALAAEPMDCLELTKAIHPYRGYPDPAYYNAFPGGLPSGVHLHALTLEEAPVWARGTGTNTANLYQDPEKPVWRVLVRNLTAKPIDAEVDLTVTDPYGKSSQHHQKVALKAGAPEQEIRISPPAEVLGLYTVQTAVKAGDFQQSRTGNFLRLPPNTRKAKPENSPWGLWSWNGGHTTNPSTEDTIRVLKALGAINNFDLSHKPNPKEPAVSLSDIRQKAGIASMHYRLEGRQMPAFTTEDPHDPAKYKAYSEEKGQEVAEQLKLHPDLKYVNVFAENMISLRVTHGMSPWAFGEPYFEYTPVEAARVRAHWLTAKAAFEGTRKYAPGVKFIFGHGAGNFCQPFFRLDDWNPDLFDGYGMDLPQFERMPERQPRATEPSLLWFLNHQLREKDLLGKKEIVHLESYFPPTGPMALTPPQQAESVVRTAVLSLALGTTKFMRTWSDYTSGDGWGSSHYGSAGMIDRAPEYNPKPSAAAFATMTRVLDLAKYDGWLDLESRSAYCVRFKDTDRMVYAAWTIRGTRPLQIVPDVPGASVVRIDMHGNEFPVKIQGGLGTVTLSSTPQWLVVKGGSLQQGTLLDPVYTDAPARDHKVIETFNKQDWIYHSQEFERFQTNHWDMPRAAGKMVSDRRENDQRQSKVFHVELQKPDQKKPMVGFYGVFTPILPLRIDGKASALGVWVNGHSAWNRFIYEIEDAKGERWLSCGTRDAWNCDDIHSWSSINHDGWRYLRFPLPANAPGDNFRAADSVWWGSDGDGIVDLPVKLTKVIIEMRPQMIYADTMLHIPDYSIELDDITAEYASAADMTPAPVKLQLAAANVLNEGAAPSLPNPHADLQKSGAGAAPSIAKLQPPAEFYNGTRLICEVTPVPGATRYKGYVAAYPDGRGAKSLAIDQQSTDKNAKSLKQPNELFFDKLRPATPLYFFVTTLDAEGKESKPSAIRKVILKDEFPFK